MPRKKPPPWEPRKTDKHSEPRIFTKLHRLFIENLHSFVKTKAEVFVYLMVADMTTGEHVEWASVSASDLSERLKMKRDTVTNALNNLELKGWIECVGFGKWGAKLYKVVLLDSLSDLKPLKTLPKKEEILVKQTELMKLTGTVLPPERAETYQGQTNDEVHFCPVKGQNSAPLKGQKCTPYLYKENLKKTTTTSQSFPKSKTKIPQELIDELPEPFRVDKGVLKLLSEALNGELVATINKEKKRIEAKDAPTLIKNIRYLRGIIESGKPIGNYNGYLCTVIANEWEAKPVAVKTQAQKAEEEGLTRKDKADATAQEFDENKRLVNTEKESDEKLLIEITALPSEELDALKTKAFEGMLQFDKTRYHTSTEFLKKSILERNMLKVYKKSHHKAAV